MREALVDLVRERGRSSIRRTFGIFFNLMDGKMGQEIPVVRNLLREVIVENFMVHQGEQLLGEVCTTQRFHNLKSASDLTGVHPTKIARVLKSAGLMPGIDKGPGGFPSVTLCVVPDFPCRRCVTKHRDHR